MATKQKMTPKQRMAALKKAAAAKAKEAAPLPAGVVRFGAFAEDDPKVHKSFKKKAQ